MPGVASDFPADKIKLIRLTPQLHPGRPYLGGEAALAVRTLEGPFFRVRPHVDLQSGGTAKDLQTDPAGGGAAAHQEVGLSCNRERREVS